MINLSTLPLIYDRHGKQWYSPIPNELFLSLNTKLTKILIFEQNRNRVHHSLR